MNPKTVETFIGSDFPSKRKGLTPNTLIGHGIAMFGIDTPKLNTFIKKAKRKAANLKRNETLMRESLKSVEVILSAKEKAACGNFALSEMGFKIGKDLMNPNNL